MIYRKPYAFLIKNFKKIHLIMTVLMIIIAYRSSLLLNFYNNYLDSLVGILEASSNIKTYMYMFCILIMIISLIMYLLMRYKKKPKLLYLVTIVFYFVLIIVFLLIKGNLSNLERSIYDVRVFLLYRDIARISMYLQYALLIPMIIRTLGFDIKKFEFKKDLQELDVLVDDNEEVELQVGLDTNKIKAKGRRRLRELGYYYQENNIFINIIFAILIIVLCIYLFINIRVVNRIYNEGETFSINNANMEIESSFITNKNYLNEDVSYDDNYYLIVKFNVLSNIEKLSLESNNFIIVIDNKTYLPTKKYYDYFKDLGNGYKNQEIKIDESKTFILVYVIPKDMINNKMILRYETGYGDNVNKRIKLEPINLMEEIEIGDSNIGEELEFKASIIEGSNINISEYDIKDSFTYTYSISKNENESYDKNVIIGSSYNTMILHIKLSSNFTSSYIDLNNANLFKYYAKIKYIKDSYEYEASIIDKTPNNYKDGVYLEVSDSINNSSDITLLFNIRGKIYNYVLKES